jgi:hypothetical protein
MPSTFAPDTPIMVRPGDKPVVGDDRRVGGEHRLRKPGRASRRDVSLQFSVSVTREFAFFKKEMQFFPWKEDLPENAPFRESLGRSNWHIKDLHRIAPGEPRMVFGKVSNNTTVSI